MFRTSADATPIVAAALVFVAAMAIAFPMAIRYARDRNADGD